MERSNVQVENKDTDVIFCGDGLLAQLKVPLITREDVIKANEEFIKILMAIRYANV